MYFKYLNFGQFFALLPRNYFNKNIKIIKNKVFIPKFDPFQKSVFYQKFAVS